MDLRHQDVINSDKDGMTEIVPHLTMVINEYTKEHKFLSILKNGLITTLYKRMTH